MTMQTPQQRQEKEDDRKLAEALRRAAGQVAAGRRKSMDGELKRVGMVLVKRG